MSPVHANRDAVLVCMFEQIRSVSVDQLLANCTFLNLSSIRISSGHAGGKGAIQRTRGQIGATRPMFAVARLVFFTTSQHAFRYHRRGYLFIVP